MNRQTPSLTELRNRLSEIEAIASAPALARLLQDIDLRIAVKTEEAVTVTNSTAARDAACGEIAALKHVRSWVDVQREALKRKIIEAEKNSHFRKVGL